MLPKIYNAKNAKTAKNAKKAKKAKNANLLQSATQSATTKAYSTTMGRAKKGGRRWSPPGGFNPPPTEGGAGRARSISIIPNIKHDTPSSNTLSQVSHEIFVFPLPKSLPRHVPYTGARVQKPRFLRLFRFRGSIFSPSETRSKNDFEKTSKKVRKSRISASQNLPQTLPKSLPNRRSKKTAFSRAFFV